MAIHSSTHSLIHEAMNEYLNIAHHCIMTGKPAGGCYGFPAALLLFSIVDTIGSYYRGNANFSVKIDGKDLKVDGDGKKHYRILNSSFYNQNLSLKDIEKVYNYYRCLLVHNSALPPNHFLNIGNPTDSLFPRDSNDKIRCVNLVPFTISAFLPFQVFFQLHQI